ncbi:MAG: hypothetical protein AB1625_00235 [Acidobacteriota bacterium]
MRIPWRLRLELLVLAMLQMRRDSSSLRPSGGPQAAEVVDRDGRRYTGQKKARTQPVTSA